MTSQSTRASLSVQPPATRVGVFDAGIGGLPLAGLVHGSRPDLEIVYLGDADRRPYGPQPGSRVARYVREAETFMVERRVEAWAIACNTASVVAPATADRMLPSVDMVSVIGQLPPFEPVEPVALLGTLGTIASGEIPRRYPSVRWAPIATEELLREAEEGGHRKDRVATHLTALAAQLSNVGATRAVLACTDFTCILPQMRAQLTGVEFQDPLDAAAEQLAALAPFRPNTRPPRHELHLTARHTSNVTQIARDTYGIHFDMVTIHALTPIETREN